LASIAAIAHVEMKTKQDQEELGNHIVIEGSKLVTQDVAVLPKGTSFAVKNLFFNIPARRNFLKSETVEFRHVMDEFQRVAMAHPSISFTLIHNGSELYNLPSSNYRQRIVNIFGGKTNEKLVPVSEETELINITGFVGKPEFAKKSRGEQFFFVNDRYIKSAYLHHAIMSAYEGLLKEGNQPSYFLYLQVPPHTIDINIHPTKTEIKFDDEHSLYAILRSAVKHSLGQFNVAPVLDFERDSNLDTPYQYKDKEADFPTIQVDSSFNPFATDKPAPKSLSSFGSYKRETSTANWESLYVGLKQETQELEQFSFESEEVTGKLFDDEVEETKSSSTYQIHKKYIVSAIKSGMLVIDQGRAHQRVLYEQFLTSITVQKASSQQLLFPLELYFSSEEMVLLKELQSSLENTGFVFDVFKSDSVQISGLPILMAESEVSIVLEELINNLQNEIPESSFSQSDSVAKSMAKSMAVKTGTYLSVKEQENLVNSLFACKDPNVSPFQKPTFITLTVEDLDKRFAL
jgi:DNA mismatch repair protein MutL